MTANLLRIIKGLVRSLEELIEAEGDEQMRGFYLRTLADGIELLHQQGAGQEYARCYPAALRNQAQQVDVAQAGWESEHATHH